MTLPARLTGGCACGAVRYACDSAPLAMVNCHCRDCQRAGGATYAPTVVVAADDFSSTGATLTHHEVRSAKGNLVWRYFCSHCGSPLFARSAGRNDVVGVRAVSLDDSSWFQASREVFTESALSWDGRIAPADSVPTLEPPEGPP